ncbi:hypothetical protein NQ318_003540 [Aromia moschata]|uniref:Cytohesin Ubiquitin Protein Inducing domain-containing protein n=1 Tax=Aromia moschata TaxID=1265417 RepID=A0AAV8YUX3_9CUCU|nr:hypothetical protein NQ318_003540 [Aromia moschata]
MGASNVNTARLTVLQERKKQIEETLAKRNQELRQLCIQEAELTGVTPPRDASRARLHANLAEAALGLANEQNMSKTVKRQHRAEYQKTQESMYRLTGKTRFIKRKSASEHKQKKKPRVPEQVDYNISISTNFNEAFVKSDLRYSMRSVKHNLASASEASSDQRYLHTVRYPYRNSEISYIDNPNVRQEEFLNTGFYRLSLNGYNKYMERRENISNMYPSTSYPIQALFCITYHVVQCK